jgi:UDP-2,3-diacylglucosamine pyrophosphatase LpxH
MVDSEGKKRCPDCDTRKLASEFPRSLTAADGLESYCRICKCKRTNAYRARVKAQRLAAMSTPPAPIQTAPEAVSGDVEANPWDTKTEPPALPPAPSDLESLSDDARTLQIVDIIAEAAEAEGVEPCDCTWADFVKYTKFAWGESRQGISRRHITKVGGFNAIRDAHYPPKATYHQVARRENQDLAQMHRERARKETRDALLVRQLEEVLASAPIRVMPAEGYARKYSDGYEGSRVVTSVWNDDHFDPGSSLLGYDETGQCRRVAKILSQHLDFKRQHRAKSEARVIINGDMIENWLHGRRGAHPSVQAVSAADKYAQVIRQLAAEFIRVHVVICPGNHDRDVAFDPKRAIDEKAYGYTTIIAGLIRAACRELKNVNFTVGGPEVVFDSFGQKVMVTHGDTIFGQVSPRKLNTTAVSYLVERFNSSVDMLGRVRMIWIAHWHVDAHATTDSGVQIRINPALTPTNEYARSFGAFQAYNGHYVYEEAPGHVYGDNRLARVTMEDSNNAALDGLIQPFTSVTDVAA